MMRQREYTDAVREILSEKSARRGREYTACVVTYGCQQNENDSERLRGMLLLMGYRLTPERRGADLVVFNTCAVREGAEMRLFGNVGALVHEKRKNPDMMIAVCGCMMQIEENARRIKMRYPHVDMVFGTHTLYRFPEILLNTLKNGGRTFDVLDTKGHIYEGLPILRDKSFSANISVMYGCNNFCSYCIVPYVRGRERSRAPEAIIDECLRLMDGGVQEIMLLGQNVNSYGGGGRAFAELLYRLDRLGIPRIRFMTSHPKDISDELIAAYGELKHLMPQLHLPVQAGNDEILRAMNRRYTREKYLETVRKLRKVCPEIGLTSDIIVGFPGETLEQFEDTMSLAREVRFDAAYTFIFSPRAGTRAAEMPDDTPYEEKSRRIQRLIDLQQRITLQILEKQVGRRETVLVESVSARDENSVGGKTPRGHMVNLPGDRGLIGKFVDVEITSAGRNTLRGKRI
jgi:tRNA-2-methylthio-N6-dimethylallyladenosine synthase